MSSVSINIACGDPITSITKQDPVLSRIAQFAGRDFVPVCKKFASIGTNPRNPVSDTYLQTVPRGAENQDATRLVFDFSKMKARLSMQDIQTLAASCKSVTEIEIQGNKVDDLSIQNIVTVFSNLTRLSITSAQKINPITVTRIFTLQNLTHLRLSGCADLIVPFMKKFQTNCTKLERLDLTNCPDLTAEKVYELLKNKALRYLRVSYFSGITEVIQTARFDNPLLLIEQEKVGRIRHMYHLISENILRPTKQKFDRFIMDHAGKMAGVLMTTMAIVILSGPGCKDDCS